MSLAQWVETLEIDMHDLKKVIQANHDTLILVMKEQLAFREIVLQKFDEVDARFVRLEGRMDGLEVRMSGVEGRIDGLETRMGGLEARMDGLEVRMDRLETRFDQMEQSVNARFDKLEVMITTLLAQRS